MTDFTEKLKAGELYYVKKKNGKIVIRQAHLYSCLRTENSMPIVDFEDNDTEKVIAPVPSYEEYQRLKKLLESCRDYILTSNFEDSWAYSLTTSIDEVLK